MLILQSRADPASTAVLRGSVTQTNCPKTAIKVKYCYKVTSDIKRNPPEETIYHLVWQLWLETALCTCSLGHQFWSNTRSFSKEPLRDPMETAIFPTETEIFPKLKSLLCSIFPCSKEGTSIFADFFLWLEEEPSMRRAQRAEMRLSGKSLSLRLPMDFHSRHTEQQHPKGSPPEVFFCVSLLIRWKNHKKQQNFDPSSPVVSVWCSSLLRHPEMPFLQHHCISS